VLNWLVRRAEAVSQLRPDRDVPTPLRRRAEPLDNLPLQLTRFIGREHDLAHVGRLLETERLVTLTGSGGIGKTRLALELAAQRVGAPAYPQGVWLVDLSPLAQADLVAQAVAEPLGVRAESEAPVQQTLLDFLRARQLLLVLDNCEHLVVACARLAEAILRGCPNVRILATSREPLHIGGESTWRVAPLTPPGRTSKNLLDNDAVRLFAERAHAVAGLVVTAESAPAVARVCQQLDGIPLAIELAAARTGVLSVDQIATRLDNRLRLLVGGGRTAPARQQTLRAAIDWSYDLLPESERRLFNSLSVFAGGWTLEAAEAVGQSQRTPSEDVFELLARLVDKSLVQAEPGSAGHLRYRLLESVRDYALEQLRDSGELVGALSRHAAYFGRLAEEAELHVLWGGGGLEWLGRLDRELPNLRAALAWSLSNETDATFSLTLSARLGHYWYTRADRAEGRSWLERSLARVEPPSDDVEPRQAAAWAWAVLWAGGLAHGQTDYEVAERLVGQALRAFERLQDPRGIGWAYSFLGHVARARAQLPVAAEHLEKAIAAFRSTPEQVSLILPLAALGFTACALGDQAQASQLLDESIALARSTGSVGRLAIASIYLGQVAFAQGDLPRAASALQEALKLFGEWRSAWGMAECLEGLAVVAAAEAHAERAARLLGAAARLRESIGAPVHPVDRAEHERAVQLAQVALGAQEFEAAWRSGQSLRVEDVLESATTVVAGPSRAASVLTGREREVAVLIARGLSNRQIAESLVIAERTVTNHVEHIFDKLGFRSRASVATWITEQRTT
jgi:predicted ATPase/DNA-binding CsgD family transcriptional regulator